MNAVLPRELSIVVLSCVQRYMQITYVMAEICGRSEDGRLIGRKKGILKPFVGPLCIPGSNAICV